MGTTCRPPREEKPRDAHPDAFAVVEVPSSARYCSESGAVIRCAVVASPDSATVHISVSARANAQAGQEGELTLTLSTPDSGTASYRPTITVGERADLVANGATVTGEVGARVPITVGFTNNGPAAVDAGGMNGLHTMAVVTVPKGTTAVTVAEYCRDAADDRPESWGSPGAAVYECSPPGPFGRGKKAQIAFQLRIDRAGSLTGRVQLRHSYQGVERRDLNVANDTATIRVNPVAGDGGQGGGDGDGGTLPITGDPTGLIAGIGGLLLAAGVGGFVVAGRRRTRFVA